MNFIAAILYATGSSVLLALALGFAHGKLDAGTAILALAGGAAVGAIGWLRAPRNPDPLPRPRGWAWVPVVLFALFAARAFLWLIFEEGDEFRVLSPNNLGDMSIHLTFINYFANGAPFWPDNPIFSQGKLTYAAGIDLFNSLLALAGLDVQRGLIWVGLVGAALSGFALWRWGGAFTLMGFLCNGGLLGFAAFVAAENQPFFRDYAGLQVFDWAWKSLPLALLVTQRGFLFALPAGLLLLTSWRTRFFLDGKGWRLPFLGELLLYASMPAFHVHTFIALSFMLAAFFIARAAARKKLAVLVACALIPATALVWLSSGMGQSNAEPMWEDMGAYESPPPRPPSEVLGWQPGWMVDEPELRAAWDGFERAAPAAAPFAPHGKFLFFWLGNFGAWPFFAGAVALLLLRLAWRKSVPASWAWVLALAFVTFTPMLGLWRSYQAMSFGDFVLGSGGDFTVRALAFGFIGIGSAIGGLMLLRWGGRHSALRWVLFFIAAVCAVDGVLMTLHEISPRIPPLRANAIPLIAALAALLLLLTRLAARWEAALWPVAFVFPALFLFFLCCNVMFAPWPWDNTKLMLWAYVILLPFVWELLIVRWPLWGRALACFALFFSGLVTLLGGINSQHKGYDIARVTTQLEVRDAVKDIPITDTFAGLPTHNHPLLLVGRKMVLGFPGHVGSHGIQYAETESRLGALMNGFADWRITAARLGARHLYFGPLEEQEWPRSYEAWRHGAQVIRSGEWGQILDLDLPPLPVDGSSRTDFMPLHPQRRAAPR